MSYGGLIWAFYGFHLVTGLLVWHSTYSSLDLLLILDNSGVTLRGYLGDEMVIEVQTEEAR